MYQCFWFLADFSYCFDIFFVLNTSIHEYNLRRNIVYEYPLKLNVASDTDMTKKKNMIKP